MTSKSFTHTAPQRILGITAAAWGLSVSAKSATVGLLRFTPQRQRGESALAFAISY